MGIQPVLDRLELTPKGDAAISTVTAMEIEYGLKCNPARARKIEPMIRALLKDLQELSFEREDAQATAWSWSLLTLTSSDGSVV